MKKSWDLYFGILLLSAATLALETMQMRIFSFTLWHHLAYLVITVALLGFGAAGAYLTIRECKPEGARHTAGRSAIGFTLTTILGFAVVLRIPLDTFMADSVVQLSLVFTYYLFLLPPFFFAGWGIAVLFTAHVSEIHRFYFWNLAGSALGCFIFLWLLVAFGGDRSIFIICSMGALSAVFLFTQRWFRVTALGLAVACLLLVPFTSFIFPMNAAPSKGINQVKNYFPDLKTYTVEWNPVGRIDVLEADKSSVMGVAGMPVNKGFVIDGDAATLAYNVDLPWKEVREVESSLYSTAYHVRGSTPNSVAIIGIGAGIDIITALHFQAEKITGVEINSAMIRAAQTHFKNHRYNPLEDPRVTVIHEEGRSHLRRASERYDIIQLSGVDTWTALSSGAYVLSENYLYTVEAFQEYFEHLSEDGILSMIRWYFLPPRECLRLCVQGVEMLRRSETTHTPENHIIVIRKGPIASFLLKKKAFTPQEVIQVQDLVKRFPDMQLLYAPGTQGDNAFYRFFRAVSHRKEADFVAGYLYNITPVTDNQPFFFMFYRWGDIFGYNPGQGGYADAMWPIGQIILLAALGQALLLGVAFVLVPLWRFKKKGMKTSGASKLVTYFAALGIGFMFIEIALMQKFVLLLGHPSYSISVVLASLLIFSGIGSLLSAKWSTDPQKIILFLGGGVAFLLLIYLAILPPIFRLALPAPHITRMVITIVLLAPIGLLIGMPFPLGLSYVRKTSIAFVPWSFGINATASVVGSILSIMIAMSWGFIVVIFLAALLYVIAGLCLYSLIFSKPEIIRNF